MNIDLMLGVLSLVVAILLGRAAMNFHRLFRELSTDDAPRSKREYASTHRDVSIFACGFMLTISFIYLSSYVT